MRSATPAGLRGMFQQATQYRAIYTAQVMAGPTTAFTAVRFRVQTTQGNPQRARELSD